MNDNYDLKKMGFYAGIALTVSFSLLALTYAYGEVKSWRHPATQGATITVTGEGEVNTTPDIATVTFTVNENAKTVPEAQKKAESKVNPAITALKKLGIAEKDIKTLSYSVNPHYEYSSTPCSPTYCPPSKSTLTGYDATESIQVKVRKIDQAGDVISLIGENNITQISGPDYTVDDIEKVTNDAKAKAIGDARKKAEAIAKSLGVSLGVIVGYNEDGGNVIYYAKDAYATGRGGAEAPQAASLPVGENTTKVRISITYALD